MTLLICWLTRDCRYVVVEVGSTLVSRGKEESSSISPDKLFKKSHARCAHQQSKQGIDREKTAPSPSYEDFQLIGLHDGHVHYVNGRIQRMVIVVQQCCGGPYHYPSLRFSGAHCSLRSERATLSHHVRIGNRFTFSTFYMQY